MSGDHAKIAEWRAAEAERLSRERGSAAQLGRGSGD